MTLIEKLKGEFAERKQIAPGTPTTHQKFEDFILQVYFIGGQASVIKVESMGDDYLIGYFRAITADSFSGFAETVSLYSIQRYRRV